MIDIRHIPQNELLKIVIGASGTTTPGWISTEQDQLNLLNFQDWQLSFKGRKIDIILAEHIWEHLSEEKGIEAAKTCFEFLNLGGFVRCAVPDRHFRNEWYQNMVQVGGPGPKDHPAYTHKIVYDYKLLKSVFEQAGFEVELLEYFDEDGNFHYNEWNPDDGKIGRSRRFDTRNVDGVIRMASLIIDARKPEKR